MKNYIATFYAHFGAIRFDRLLKAAGLVSSVRPVPRDLSSSCGSCVCYTAAEPWPEGAVRDEVEQIVAVSQTGYETVFIQEDM